MNYLMGFAQLADALGAELAVFGPQCPAGFDSVVTDSRKAASGSLFAALRGTENDGHRFAAQAVEAGAAGVLAEKAAAADESNFGLVSLCKKNNRALIACEGSSLFALQEAARVYLKQFPSLVKVGITGSSGKTTTKEIAASIIGVEKNVCVNPGNLNSETGLPLAVFGINKNHEVAVNELGMNRPGEIAELARVFSPGVALITGIGTAHIGIFRTKSAIALEKKAIFSQFTGVETALIPGDDEFRDFLAEGTNGKIRFYNLEEECGKKKELGPVEDRGLEGYTIFWEGRPARFPLPGRHNLRDAFAAIAIARELGVSGRAVREGLERVKPLFGRGEIFRGRVTLFRDCYNANPESAEAAIDFCDSLETAARRVYVIGSMLELGDASAAAHRALGRRLAASKADMVFLYGEETEEAAAELEGAAGVKTYSHTNDMKTLERELDARLRGGEYVLLKGSRGCALERLTEMLTGGECNVP